MILLIDNYDSFSYNVYQFLGAVVDKLKVIRNDEMTVEEVRALNPKAIVISPGPGKPRDAGICEAVIKELGKSIPILGICLGHQAICETFGGEVTYANELMHGKQSEVSLDTKSPLFQKLGEKMKVARYHSLAASPEKMPEELKIIGVTAEGEIMAVEHKAYPIYGVQFHPESILTPNGMDIIKNFCNIAEQFA